VRLAGRLFRWCVRSLAIGLPDQSPCALSCLETRACDCCAAGREHVAEDTFEVEGDVLACVCPFPSF
jgi:hypothetical protein